MYRGDTHDREICYYELHHPMYYYGCGEQGQQIDISISI
jgi:hypothetical protein